MSREALGSSSVLLRVENYKKINNCIRLCVRSFLFMSNFDVISVLFMSYFKDIDLFMSKFQGICVWFYFMSNFMVILFCL